MVHASAMPSNASAALCTRFRAGIHALPVARQRQESEVSRGRSAVLASVDWRVQVAAIAAATIIVVSIIFGLLFSKQKDLQAYIPIALALLVVPAITGLVSLFKADENSRKLDAVTSRVEKIDNQTNGGLGENVETAVREAITKILAANEEEARRDRRREDRD